LNQFVVLAGLSDGLETEASLKVWQSIKPDRHTEAKISGLLQRTILSLLVRHRFANDVRHTLK